MEKGTFEALVHEAVFATTFIEAQATGDTKDQSEPGSDGKKPGWKDFSSGVLLCLPVHMEKPKFENEFTRCCIMVQIRLPKRLNARG